MLTEQKAECRKGDKQMVRIVIATALILLLFGCKSNEKIRKIRGKEGTEEGIPSCYQIETRCTCQEYGKNR